MRIISPFRDYYDCIQATGQDQSLVYLRETEVLKGNLISSFPSLSSSNYWRFRENICELEQIIVGFCGKVYPIIKLCVPKTMTKAVFCVKAEDIHNIIENECPKKFIEKYNEIPKKPYRWKSWGYSLKRQQVDKFFEECKQVKSKFNKIFLDEEIPIFLEKNGEKRYSRKTILNACLKDVEFFRIIDPYTAFQELSMYWGGIAHPNRPIPHVPDKIMAEAKGFNKWSFRKPPSKK